MTEEIEGEIGLSTRDRESGNLYAVAGDGNTGVYAIPQASPIFKIKKRI